MNQREVVERICDAALRWSDPEQSERVAAVHQTLSRANTFTPEAIGFALDHTTAELTDPKLTSWLNGRSSSRPSTVCVLSAGNIPAVEFQDWLAVILTGHRYLGVLSSKSNALLPAFVESARLGDSTTFVSLSEGLELADALVATGSDDTVDEVGARALAGGIRPDRTLFRGTSYSVAVLSGKESESDMLGLAEDCLLHEARGCRSVPIVWVPRGFSPDDFLGAAAMFRSLFPAHASTMSSLRIPKALLEALGVPCAFADDLSFLVSLGEPAVQEPCHIRWVEYDAVVEAWSWVQQNYDEIQLVAAAADVSAEGVVAVPLGTTQRLPITWLPDGVDTVEFLCGL
jgi:hypothetical protein